MNIFKAVADLEDQCVAGALCTIIEAKGSTPRHDSSKMLVKEDGSIVGTIGGGLIEQRVRSEALDAIVDGKSRRLAYNLVDPSSGDPGICGGTMEVFVEPILPKPMLIIVGGGHVGKAVTSLGKWAGFFTVVNDDRPDFCTPEFNPDANKFIISKMEKIPEFIKITPYTYIILTTRGSDVDIQGLGVLLPLPARYFGIIGSRRRWITTRKGLIDQGVPEELLDRVHSPIGLELHAETPEEIAVSIIAEVLMIKNGGTGSFMKL